MNELIVRWKNGETAIYRFTTKGDAVTAKMIFENHCGNEIRDIKINALEQQSSEDCISREEAKQFLYERIDRLNDDELYDIFSRIIDDMYNELPPVTPSYNSIKTETPSYNSIKTELKSCEDCISRQAVIDYAKDTCVDLDKYEDTEIFCDEIKALPPVIPERPKGKWIEIEIDAGEFIYKCTKCGMRVINPYKYCPNCGAEMEGEEKVNGGGEDDR